MPFLFHNRRRHFTQSGGGSPALPEGSWTFSSDDFPDEVTWLTSSLPSSPYAVCPTHDGDGVLVLSTYAANAYFDSGSCEGFNLASYSQSSRSTSRFQPSVLCTHDGLRYLLQKANVNTTLCILSASTAYDLTTLDTTALSSSGSTYNPFGENDDGEGFAWASVSPDGEHVLFLSGDINDVRRLRSFDLGTAWDISSHTNAKCSIVSKGGPAWVNPNGCQIIQAEYATSTTYDIVLYTLSAPWDASSVSGTGVKLGTVTLPSATAVTSVFVNPDGDKIVIVLFSGKYAIIDMPEEDDT